jgi:hypothetical protein
VILVGDEGDVGRVMEPHAKEERGLQRGEPAAEDEDPGGARAW